MMSTRRRSRSHDVPMTLWLRRNMWMIAAVALVIIYCIFMVRTTMLARSFDVREQQNEGETTQSDAMKGALAALKEMGALKDEKLQEQAQEKAEEAAEDGRGQLTQGEGEQEAVGEAEAHNQHSEATTRPRLPPEETEDTVAYDDKIPLEDAGDIPMVGTTETPAPTEEGDDKWTAFEDLPLAGEASNETAKEGGNVQVTAATGAENAPEQTAMKPMTAVVAATTNNSEHLWAGDEKMPVVQENAGESSEKNHARDPATIPEVPDAAVSQAPPGVTEERPQSRRFDVSRLILDMPSQERIPFEKRHDKVAGYNATLAYLQNYTKPADSKETLFLFFTCSNAQGEQEDWTSHCGEAREKVYATFAKSPSSNRLVTIYAGTREDWRGGNEFTDDDDLRLKALPTVMRWDGGAPGALRSTWGVLVGQSVLYEPLLRYLFHNADEQDKKLAQPEVLTKEIVTLKGYAQYRTFMEEYARSGTPYPLFMMMVSGRFQRNNRLWCPWCRQSEMPVEYAFYAYAPANSKLVLVETYDRYSEWRNPENEFKKDPQLAMKGVPWFYRIYPGPPGQPLTYQRVKQKFYLLEALQSVFEGS
ncbi:hypothetical protein PHYBOEH_007783 [Phytophthora boehmeriae]|uniref:Thioredoxin domain-containing protein n=1 Tax=Phytophthora boehmeriae TaxID=109152 RepID=A0A8T1W5Q6_9STRA|nr:hypothetical protein PHYBOEH_007783 [Phytophthora boehmeriae]